MPRSCCAQKSIRLWRNACGPEHNIKVLEDIGVISSLRNGAERAHETQDLQSALSMAVQLEKDTALFYANIVAELGIGDRQEGLHKIIKLNMRTCTRSSI